MVRGPKGTSLSEAELRELGAPPEIGSRFWTDRLDVNRREYVVVEVTAKDVVVRRVRGRPYDDE